MDGVAPHIEELRKLKEDVLDPYATQRSVYRQIRQKDVDAARDDRRATLPGRYPKAACPVGAPPPPDTGNTGPSTLPLPTVSPAITRTPVPPAR